MSFLVGAGQVEQGRPAPRSFHGHFKKNSPFYGCCIGSLFSAHTICSRLKGVQNLSHSRTGQGRHVKEELDPISVFSCQQVQPANMGIANSYCFPSPSRNFPRPPNYPPHQLSPRRPPHPLSFSHANGPRCNVALAPDLLLSSPPVLGAVSME